MDLFSRQIIGWSMGSRIDSELAMNALVMACWRRKPTGEVIVHSDQGCQYTSYDWRSMLKGNGLRRKCFLEDHMHELSTWWRRCLAASLAEMPSAWAAELIPRPDKQEPGHQP